MVGTCFRGGEYGGGTIWKINDDGSGYSILRSLDPTQSGVASALIEGPNETLFGLLIDAGLFPAYDNFLEYPPAGGSLFRMSESGEEFQLLRTHVLHGGVYPSSLLMSGSRIYVGLSATRTNQSASIYSVETDGSDFRILHQFLPGEAQQLGRIIEASDHNFYFTAGRDVWRVTPSGSAIKIFSRFSPLPFDLLEGADGALYGNNRYNGFFRLTKDGADYSTAIAVDNASLGTRMVEDEPGVFLTGGSEIRRIGWADQTSQAFHSLNGTFGLVKDARNFIVGLTWDGGALGYGTVYRLGAPMFQPTLQIEGLPSTSVVIRAASPAGTTLEIDSASAPGGPWAPAHWTQPTQTNFTIKLPTTSTNLFFKAQLQEY